MKHIFGFSGGKDSTAMLLWAIEQGHDFSSEDSIAVFSDTGWEHPLTYAYVEEINRKLLHGNLVTLKSKKYDGFVDLVQKRKRFPSPKNRFCTTELKMYPLYEFFEMQDDEITSYVGVRAQESATRSKLNKTEWVDQAGGYWLERPIFTWTHDQVFDIMKRHDIEPNPLYLLGSSRVGCWPCINAGLGTLKKMIKMQPEIVDHIEKLENIMHEIRPGATFFTYGKIPREFRKHSITYKGETFNIPTIRDIVEYLDTIEDDLPDDVPQCMSIYNLCE